MGPILARQLVWRSAFEGGIYSFLLFISYRGVNGFYVGNMTWGGRSSWDMRFHMDFNDWEFSLLALRL